MRYRSDVESEISSLQEKAKILKWLGIVIAFFGTWLAIQQGSWAVWGICMASAMLVFGLWGGEVARAKALREGLEDFRDG